MKKSNKTIIIVISIVLVIMLIVGGVAYAYIATDLFKSNKEMFFKYFSQVTDKDTGIINKNLNDYFTKKSSESYQNRGNIKFNYSDNTGTNMMDSKISDKLNELSIEFDGISNKEKNITNRNITINYGNDVTFPIKYIKDQELHGVQSKYIGSKYVSIRNSNLQQLASKLGMDTTFIPNKIEISEKKEKIKFTEEELAKIKSTYGPIIEQGLTDDNFSKEANNKGESNYILAVSGDQLKNIMINLLEAFKQDKDLIKRLNENINLTEINTSKQITQQQISEILKELQEKDSSEFKELKIMIGYSKKSVNEIMIQYDQIAINMKKEKNSNSEKYSIILQINNNEEQEDVKYISTVRIDFEANYNGLDELKDVSGEYMIKIKAITNDNTDLQYQYNITNEVQFNDSIDVVKLDNRNTFILNDVEDNVLTSFLTKASERIQTVNKEQMQQLGLEEDENPLLYTNFITYYYVETIKSVQSIYENSMKTYEMNSKGNE